MQSLRHINAPHSPRHLPPPKPPPLPPYHEPHRLPHCSTSKRLVRDPCKAAAHDCTGVLSGKTLGIIGYGDIGKACGRLARAFQMRVVAFRRRPEMSEADRVEGVLSRVYGPAEYTDMIATCDYIVMATPATPDTHKMFNAVAVAAMRSNAVFVNVGRGTCVDEAALTAALQAGAWQVAPLGGGAATDVLCWLSPSEVTVPSGGVVWC